MPYFDYCSSLIIYYSKKAIQKLANCYYLCVFKLFKLTFNSDDINDVNDKLKQFGIFSLHHRIVKKISIFVAKIFIFKNPPNLANQLKLNPERNIPYSLRNKNCLIQPRTFRKYGEHTFSYFFSKFINNNMICKFESNSCLKDIKLYTSKNLNNLVTKVVSDFDKLNFSIKYFYCFCR